MKTLAAVSLCKLFSLITDQSFLPLERLEYLTSDQAYNWLVEILSFFLITLMWTYVQNLMDFALDIINSGDGGASAANVK